MTDSLSFSPRLLPVSPLRPVSHEPAVLQPRRPSGRLPLLPSRTALLFPREDRVSQGMLAVLLVATLPTVAYSLFQAWHLAGGESLTQAVRALVP